MRVRPLSLLFQSTLLLALSSLAAAVPLTFSNTGSLTTGRAAHAGAVLSDGRVLVSGGLDDSFAALGSAELFTPASGTWSSAGSLATPRYFHTATTLPNGSVLVAGGNSGSGALASAERYTPGTGLWTPTGALATARNSHSATLLADGRVLVVGGFTASGGVTASAEIYDPATGLWTSTGSLSTARYLHTATRLPNGKVLVAAGFDLNALLTSAELFDPATGLWTAAGNLTAGRHSHTATLLADGRVLVAGGSTLGTNLASAELYQPSTNAWTATGSLAEARALHFAARLTSGRVLVGGGFNENVSLASAQLYDPSTGLWTDTGSLVRGRDSLPAQLLADGRVLVSGGFGGQDLLTSAELYDPGDSAPAFVSANTATFTIGQASSFQVVVTGQPVPTLQLSGTLPSGIAFTAGTGQFTGTAAPGTAGNYPLVLTASNGVNPSAQQNFTLVINTAPIARGDRFATPPNTAVSFPAARLLLNDTDPDGDALSVSAVDAASAASGTVQLQSGNLLYTPASGFQGEDSFRYTVSDGRGGLAIGLVQVSVGTGTLASPTLSSVQRELGGTRVRWFELTTRNFRVEYSDTLTGTWTPFPAPVTSNSSGLLEFFDATLPAPTRRFYRAVSQP